MKTIFGAVIWNPYRSKRPRGFYNLLRGHSGVDLNYVFEELPSPVSGKIDKITKQPEMGNVIYLSDIEQGAIHVFAHMSKINVDVGQHIKVGDVLGVTGNSGSRTTSPHLHYEVITFKKPDKKSPQPYDILFSPLMTRSLYGYQGWNIDPIYYVRILYAKYHVQVPE